MSPDEKQLLDHYRALDDHGRRGLLDYAAFLVSRRPAQPEALIEEPVEIPRPAQESVIKAIRRLSQSYPMLDKGKVLNETSSLVAQHVVQGRDAVEVIDELEVVFRRHYERHRGA